MTQSDTSQLTSAPPSPLDYQRFGERLGHHGTLPRAVTPGQSFVQLLKIRSRGGVPSREPSVFIWCFDPEFGIIAVFFPGERLREASRALESCWSSELAAVRGYLLSDGLQHAESFRVSDISGLDMLVSH